jgi:hypothetical protein
MGEVWPGANETSSLARRRVTVAFLLPDADVFAGGAASDPASAEDAVGADAGGSLPEPLPGGLAELVKHGYRMRRHRVQGLEVSSSLARTHLNFCVRQRSQADRRQGGLMRISGE